VTTAAVSASPPRTIAHPAPRCASQCERRGLGIERCAEFTAQPSSRMRQARYCAEFRSGRDVELGAALPRRASAVSGRRARNFELEQPASTATLQLLSECDGRALAGAVGESAGRRVGCCCRRHHVAGTEPRSAVQVVARGQIVLQRNGLQVRGGHPLPTHIKPSFRREHSRPPAPPALCQPRPPELC
jgi:hypothetical protein